MRKDRDWSRQADLLGLTILPQNGQNVTYLSPEKATIKFQIKMRNRMDETAPAFTRSEVSTFVKLGPRWVYLDSSEVEDVDDDVPEVEEEAVATG